jgi:pimeloyl-ACP methyl ester carboxylesterase
MIVPRRRKLVLHKTVIASYEWRANARSGLSAVILLHGWRSRALVWADFATELAERGYAVYAFDFPGFGESESPAAPQRLDDYVAVLADFVKKYGLSSVILVAHSFGGRVALKYAASRPHVLEKLVLADSAGIKPPERTLVRNLAKLARPLFRPGFMQRPRRKIYELIGAGDYLATPPLQKTFVNIVGEDLTPYLSRIACPALIVWGGRDTETPPEMAETMRKAIPRARLLVFEEAGHFSFVDEPERFADACLSFFTSS